MPHRLEPLEILEFIHGLHRNLCVSVQRNRGVDMLDFSVVGLLHTQEIKKDGPRYQLRV